LPAPLPAAGRNDYASPFWLALRYCCAAFAPPGWHNRSSKGFAHPALRLPFFLPGPTDLFKSLRLEWFLIIDGSINN
jgi:hypothetical protein